MPPKSMRRTRAEFESSANPDSPPEAASQQPPKRRSTRSNTQQAPTRTERPVTRSTAQLAATKQPGTSFSRDDIRRLVDAEQPATKPKGRRRPRRTEAQLLATSTQEAGYGAFLPSAERSALERETLQPPQESTPVTSRSIPVTGEEFNQLAENLEAFRFSSAESMGAEPDNPQHDQTETGARRSDNSTTLDGSFASLNLPPLSNRTPSHSECREGDCPRLTPERAHESKTTRRQSPSWCRRPQWKTLLCGQHLATELSQQLTHSDLDEIQVQRREQRRQEELQWRQQERARLELRATKSNVAARNESSCNNLKSKNVNKSSSVNKLREKRNYDKNSWPTSNKLKIKEDWNASRNFNSENKSTGRSWRLRDWNTNNGDQRPSNMPGD